MPATSSFKEFRGGLNRVAPTDARLSQFAPLQLVRELDRVIDALWIAGFALVDLAETTANHVGQQPLSIQVGNASEQLWMALDAADALYCSLAGMGDAIGSARPADRQ